MRKIVPGNFCVFFVSFTALTLLLFFAGNFQGFTARALFFLLDILKVSSFLCALSGAVYLIVLVRGVIVKSLKPLARNLAFAVFSLLFGLGVLFAAQFIIVLTLPKL